MTTSSSNSKSPEYVRAISWVNSLAFNNLTWRTPVEFYIGMLKVRDIKDQWMRVDLECPGIYVFTEYDDVQLKSSPQGNLRESNECVLYVGKAGLGKSTNLRTRIRTYAKNMRHRGAAMILGQIMSRDLTRGKAACKYLVYVRYAPVNPSEHKEALKNNEEELKAFTKALNSKILEVEKAAIRELKPLLNS